MNGVIDYSLVARAIDFYVGQGFEYVEAPWLASNDAMMLTMPDWQKDPYLFKGQLYSPVGSAEQSFVDMMMRGELERGKQYVAAGPCFRNEPVIDELHQASFFKVELMWFDDATLISSNATKERFVPLYSFFAQQACLLHRMLFGEKHLYGFVPTKDGLDLNMNGIEVGSYGYRYGMNVGEWVYGTGLVLPRASIAQRSHVL